MSERQAQLNWRPTSTVASTSSNLGSNRQNGIAAGTNSTAHPHIAPAGHHASVPIRPSAGSYRPPATTNVQPAPSQAVDIAAMQEQYRKWKDNFFRSQQSNAAVVALTPHLTQLYLDVTAQQTQRGTMPVSMQPQSHVAGSHSLDAKFWNAVSKVSPDLQREIFRELQTGGEEAFTSVRNLNVTAGQSSSTVSAATTAHAAASSPTIAAPQHFVRQARPPRPPPSARADQSVFGGLLPPNFATHPRFVPYQVSDYSSRYTDKCRPFISVDEIPTTQDKWSKFKKPRDTRSAAEMLRPFASGVGRLIGGLVGADLLDREASAVIKAIQSLQQKQEASDARAARAEEKVAALERQIYALQGLLQPNSAVAMTGSSSNALSLHAQEIAKLNQQILVLYRHQKGIETRVNGLDKQSGAGSREGSTLSDIPPVAAQTSRVDVGVQQVHDAEQQTDEQTSNERNRRSLSGGSATSRRSGNQGLLQLVATELEKENPETDAQAPEGGGNPPAQDSGVALSAAVKAEDEADELTSDREDTPTTSQSPPIVSPPDQRFQQQFASGRADGTASDSASQPTAATTTNAKPLKRKRPSTLETSFIIIDSSDEER